jgi:MscS family membrane protein
MGMKKIMGSIFKSLTYKFGLFALLLVFAITGQAQSVNDSNVTLVDTPVTVLELPVADSIKSENLSDAAKVDSNIDISPESILEYISGGKIIYTIFILLLTYLFLKLLSKILNVWGELSTKRRVAIKGIIPLLRIIVWIGAISFILISVIKPPMASLMAFGASVGVAVGFASQDLLKNIFGGITIIFDRPFKVGDKVSIGEHYGEIVEVGLRSTRLVTPDDNLVSVPNAELMNKSVANANAGEDNCQVVTDVYLPIHTDTLYARKIAYDAAAASAYIYIKKPIVVLFQQEVIANRIVLRMRIKAYVNDTRMEFAFKSDITEILTKELFLKDKIDPTRLERD